MLKAILKGTIILGLSDKNIELLTKGRPIKFNLSTLGLQDMEVIIFHGSTEQEMYKMIKDGIDPENTILKDDNTPFN